MTVAPAGRPTPPSCSGPHRDGVTVLSYRLGSVAGVGMFTDYFVATPEQAAALGDDGPADADLPTLELKWVEPAVLGSKLWAIVEDAPVRPGDTLPFDLDRFNASGKLIALSEDATSGLQQIADGFVRALAGLSDERIPAVSARWATAEEWIAPWEPGELDGTVEGLRDLARQVRLPDQHMYMWWSL
jgi:hypothetical protein